MANPPAVISHICYLECLKKYCGSKATSFFFTDTSQTLLFKSLLTYAISNAWTFTE
jgi:hypothetical protein